MIWKERCRPSFFVYGGLSRNRYQNNSKSENESISEGSNLDKTEQTDDLSTNNIIKIRDSLFARTDSIVIFLTQDGEPCDQGPYNKKRDPWKDESHKTGVQIPHSLNSKNQSFRLFEGKNPQESIPVSI